MTNEEIKNYVLLMLGAPVIKIELDEEQIEMSIDHARKVVSQYQEKAQKEVSESQIAQLIQEGSLANCMVILGHIRSKYSQIDDGDGICLSGKRLLRDGYNCKELWTNRLIQTFYFESEKFMQVLTSLLNNSNLCNNSPNGYSIKKCIELTKDIMQEIDK